MSYLISLQDVSKTYGEGEGKTIALNHVDLEIDECDFLVILGDSGSGKSTLLNLIGSLDSPSEGRILLRGEELTRFNPKQVTEYRRNVIGFVYQNFHLIPELTALENVTLNPSSRDKSHALALLEELGLKDKANKYPKQLSGGEQQRVSIARAVNKDVKVLLADEPTGSLDAENSLKILEVLRQIHQKGIAIVMVTHNEEMKKYATHLVRMKDGKIVFEERYE